MLSLQLKLFLASLLVNFFIYSTINAEEFQEITKAHSDEIYYDDVDMKNIMNDFGRSENLRRYANAKKRVNSTNRYSLNFFITIILFTDRFFNVKDKIIIFQKPL